MKMRFVSGLLFFASFVAAAPSLNGAENSVAGLMKDSRDGRSYKTVAIGNRVWMAQNLDFKFDKSSCYENDEANCEKYGRLYNWSEANSVCPEHWHLPSLIETESMVNFIGGRLKAGSLLKAASGWNNRGAGVDKYGFSFAPAGLCDIDGSCDNAGDFGYFWTATGEGYGGSVWYFNKGDSTGHSGFNPGWRLSVRCVSDSILDVPNYMTDSRDGHLYKTLDMGDLTWMAENLEYRENGKTGYYCYEDNDANCSLYGRLYSFAEAMEACPAGWSLPNEIDARRMVEKVQFFDKDFMPKAAGMRTAEGKYMSMNTYGYFWTNAMAGKNKAKYFYWSPKKKEVKWLAGNHGSALSVRCVKINDNFKIERGVFTDPRDQRIYKTIKIGGKTWFAENQAYRTDQSTCFDDDPSNCIKYGRLYNFEEAVTACPAGWHISTGNEFKNLLDQVGKHKCEMNCLYGKKKNGSCEGNLGLEMCIWDDAAKKLAQYDFSIQIGGVKYFYEDVDEGKQVNRFEKGLVFWGAREPAHSADPVVVEGSKIRITPSFREGGCYSECESNFYSVRCVKD
ncbi:MAG: hypothetical protein MJY87_08615 [Fibrobacter sp.]|nr:hypothetical protein [Fibrobacter sp.]